VRPSRLDRGAKRRPGMQEVILTDEILEGLRPQAGGQRSVIRLGAPVPGFRRTVVLAEQPLHGANAGGR
jgi:hypothetical protein